MEDKFKSITWMLGIIIILLLVQNIYMYVLNKQHIEDMKLLDEKYSVLISNQNISVHNQVALNTNLVYYTDQLSQHVNNFTESQNKRDAEFMIQLKSFRTDIRVNCLSPQ